MPTYDNLWYWYQQGGFVMAVDAMSLQDAAQTVKEKFGKAEYKGRFPAGAFPKTACGVTSEARQEQISARLRRSVE